MRIRLLSLLLLLSISSFAQFKNIRLDEENEKDRVAEPSVVINHKDPNNIVVASGQDNIHITKDGGLNWKKVKVTSPFGMYGDPVLISTDKGTLYYLHLSDPTGEGRQNEKSLDHIVCHESKDGGEIWDEGTVIGSNPPKDQDKPWATLDDKGNLVVTWTQFDKYGDTDPNCQSLIMLSTSSNGKKWSKPLQISQTAGDCADAGNTTKGSSPAIGADGKMFVAWSSQDKIFLDRSFDGKMWLSNDITVTTQKGGASLKVPGHDRCNATPILAINNAKIFLGSLDLVFSDQRNGETDTDVWFVRSSTYGDNWTTPMKIGDDSLNRHQYLPWMTIDQITGYIYIVYYDRRNYDDNQTDVYLSYSSDGGLSFKNVKISETPFTPINDNHVGDYTNIYAHNGIITPVWARIDDGKTSVWTTIIKQADLIKPKEESKGKKKK